MIAEKPKSGSLFDRSPKSSLKKQVAVDPPAISVTTPPAPPPASATPALTPSHANHWTCAPLPPTLSPCPACGSAIRWLNAAGQPRCQNCQPPKFASLVRRREILVLTSSLAKVGSAVVFVPVRRWEAIIGLPGGYLSSESGTGPSTLTEASGGVDGSGGEVRGGGGGNFFEKNFVEIDPAEFFEPQKIFGRYIANDSPAAMQRRAAARMGATGEPAEKAAGKPTKAKSVK